MYLVFSLLSNTKAIRAMQLSTGLPSPKEMHLRYQSLYIG